MFLYNDYIMIIYNLYIIRWRESEKCW